jgi:hypothetical protein
LKPTPEADKHESARKAENSVGREAVGRPSQVAQVAGLVLALGWLTLGSDHAYAQNGTTPQPASPPGQSERDQRARAMFEMGRQAYGDGRYRDAWANFHEAYQLSGRPELLYNIGQTADRLGQDSDALKAFRMYMERLPDAKNRRDVENRIHALEERVSASATPPPQSLPEESPQQAPATGPTTIDVAPAPPGARKRGDWPAREGFYFRSALGLGLRTDSRSGNDPDESISGFGFAGDLAAGYGVLPGFVVGGALFLDWTSPANLTMFGAYVDWYIKRETAGWHIEGAVTVASLSVRGELRRSSPSGIGLVLGGGYEWPIAGDWAIGVLGRLTIAGLTDDTNSHGFIAPSILASVTWF